MCNKWKHREVSILADNGLIRSRIHRHWPYFPFAFFFLSFTEIIDDLAHLVDKTDDRIRNETRRVKLVENKSASCGEPPRVFRFTVSYLLNKINVYAIAVFTRMYQNCVMLEPLERMDLNGAEKLWRCGWAQLAQGMMVVNGRTEL